MVFLPENSEPHFNWAPVKVGEGGNEYMDPSDLVQANGHLSWKRIETRTNGWTGQNLGYTIQVWYDEDFLTKHRHGDRALFAATQGLDTAGWCGPIVVCCRSMPGPRPGRSVEILDMDTSAFSHLASFLVDHSNVKSDHLFRRGPKVQCVEFSCEVAGDRVVCLPRTHPRFHKESVVSSISKVNPFREYYLQVRRPFEHLADITYSICKSRSGLGRSTRIRQTRPKMPKS